MFDPNALMGNASELLVDVGVFVAVVLVGILLGYLIGSLVAAILKRILKIRELKEQIASSEIISLAFWGKLINGIGVYVKWLFIAVVLNSIVEGFAGVSSGVVEASVDNPIWYVKLSEYTLAFKEIMANLGIFLIFAMVGIVIGAIVYKIIKSALDSVRIEEHMAKHGLHDALGGLQLTKVIAGIFMIYVIIVLMGTGIDLVADRSGIELVAESPDAAGGIMADTPKQTVNNVGLVVMFRSLVELYPQFVLGGFIIIVGAILGDFIQDRIRKSKASLASESVAWMAQAMIVFFAIVLALPHFQIKENVDILTDSFKIIVAGLSIGLAIAMGLGMQDTFRQWGKKVEKKI